ncbi:MAG TPA: response regulator [Gemmatimonadales bacterium]
MTASSTAILLVEDDANDVLLIRRAFAKAAITNPVHNVEDGDAAVAYLAGEGSYADRDDHPLPAVVLLDLKLPRRSGLEVLEWVRQNPALRRLPIVVLTSSRESTDVNRAYDLGANSYLVKPVGFDALTDLVRILQGYWVAWNEKPEIDAA